MNQKDILLEYPNIPLKNIPKNNDNLFTQKNCAVAVHYWIYDKKRKTILNYGSSRACGCNHTKSSIHAEQIAIDYCRKHHKNNRLQIIIWRCDKNGKIKSIHCCHSCLKIIQKYNFENSVFTYENDKIILATGSPYIPLAYKIKYDLKNH